MGDEMKYSEGQRNQIYEKYLRPLKLKISQILLYDTNAAADFLKKYNNLLQKTSDSELFDKITELELEIEQYEKIHLIYSCRNRFMGIGLLQRFSGCRSIFQRLVSAGFRLHQTKYDRTMVVESVFPSGC